MLCPTQAIGIGCVDRRLNTNWYGDILEMKYGSNGIDRKIKCGININRKSIRSQKVYQVNQ